MITRVRQALAAALIVVAACAPAADAPTRVTLDAHTRFQTIDAWATNLRLWEEDKRNDRYNHSIEPALDNVFTFLVDSVGINGVRLEIPSGIENPTSRWAGYRSGKVPYSAFQRARFEKINDNDDPRVADTSGFQFDDLDFRIERMFLPLKRRLEARGETLHVNVNYVDFKWKQDSQQGTLSHAKNPEEFAEFVVVCFQHLRQKYGIVPDAFEVILEPENTEAWRGETIGRALVAAADRLKANGFTPEIIAPSNSQMRNAITYFDEMIAVPGVLDRLRTFAYHRYRLERRDDVLAIASRARAHHLKTAMLEKVGAGIDVLLEDLVDGNVSAWQQWAAAGSTANADNGGYYARVEPSDSTAQHVFMARLSTHLAQLFQAVRRGAIRIGASSDNPDKRVVAFINRDQRWVVVARAKAAGGRVTVSGLPPGQYGVSTSTEAQRRVYHEPITVGADSALTTTMAEAGVLAIVRLPAARP
ncbi:MAG: hypothetical protein V4550_15550 [Gemmatimonadota bacterium]